MASSSFTRSGSSTPPTSVSEPPTPPAKMKVTLSGTQGTLLATLYARYWDAMRGPLALFADRWAPYTVDQIDWDWSRFSLSRMFCYLISLRGRRIDSYTQQFLARHRETGATVIHMACGLDARVHRMADMHGGILPPKTQWIDVDLPDVVPLRRALLPPTQTGSEGESEYKLMAASVLDPEWLASMPADRPTLLIAEGLAFYLDPAAGKRMIRDLTEHFRHAPGGGEIVMDTVGTIVVRLQFMISLLRAVKARFRWGIDSGREVERCHPSLRLLEDTVYACLPGIERMDWWNRLLLWLTRGAVPNMGRILRLRFGVEGEDAVGGVGW